MRALLIGLILLAEITFAGCSSKNDMNEHSSFEYSEFDGNDAAMNAAIEKAKASIDQFHQAFLAQKSGTKEFYVKKAFPTPDGDTEHIWVEVYELQDGVFKGTIVNEPVETKVVEFGQAVEVKSSEITDWKYEDGRKLVGGFTIRCFVEMMTPEEKQAFLEEAGFEL